MDAETLAHAFDEYYSTKPSGKGTGLGLAVCKSLMESMGGEITLNSEPGAGTTATLRIPFTAPETEGDV
jgi:signal transduction histidine kinase